MGCVLIVSAVHPVTDHFSVAVKPVLVIAIGNPSRGDDALGPLLADTIAEQFTHSAVEWMVEFQLQVEHIYDVDNRDLVLFVDAGVGISEPLQFERVFPDSDACLFSHALPPGALIYHYLTLLKPSRPACCYLLRIKGADFDLGASLSPVAVSSFEKAQSLVRDLLEHPVTAYWDLLLSDSFSR
jgi:hydrogenase maturation protease